jgi:hypothetical protein
MNLTTRDDFKRLNKRPPTAVEINGLGTVYFRQPSGGEWLSCMEKMQAWQRLNPGGDNGQMPPLDLTYLVVGVALSDANGDRIYPDDALGEIAEMPPETLYPLFTQAFCHVFELAGGVDTAKKD